MIWQKTTKKVLERKVRSFIDINDLEHDINFDVGARGSAYGCGNFRSFALYCAQRNLMSEKEIIKVLTR